MNIIDKYAKVKKRGYQLYKKECIIVSKKLIDRLWTQLSMYFTTTQKDYRLAYFNDETNTTIDESNYYCDKVDFKKRIEPALKREIYYM